MTQTTNFFSDPKNQFIMLLAIIVIVTFIISKMKLYDKKDKVGSGLKITLTLFIIFMGAISSYIIIFGTGITAANILSTIASFTAPMIAFSGAYTIFEFGQKKADQEKKDREDKEKKELEDKEKKELEHKKTMLFTMLEYSLLQTRIPSKSIEKNYEESYKTLSIGNDEFLHSKYNLKGRFVDDFNIMWKVESPKDYSTFMKYCNDLDEIFLNELKKHKISDRVIYIGDWYNYLDCISSTEDVQMITFWINLVEHAYKSENCYTYLFLVNRNNTADIISKLNPKVIDEGLRGKLGVEEI